MSIFRRRLDTCTSGAQRRGNRAIDSYDYIRCGETLKKVSCSIGSAWVGAGAAFDESGHSKVWEGWSKGERMGIRGKINFLWGLGFLWWEEDREEGLFFNLGSTVLEERLAVKVSAWWFNVISSGGGEQF